MASSSEPAYGLLRFNEPDRSIKSEDRSLFALAASKSVVTHKLVLHDARNDGNIVKGPGGLDTQGFAFIKHRSALVESNEWFSGQNVEDVYLPEVKKLICEVTGAKSAVINSVAFRRKLVEMQKDPMAYLKRGCIIDQELSKMPKNKVMVYGKEEGGSLEPARGAHIDYSLVGLRRTARECRKDIAEVCKEAMDAEDRVKNGEDVEVPRYAAYSVWRPVKTIRRDPLVVCDWRTVDKDELYAFDYRALSDINKNGEYTMNAYGMLPPKKPDDQKWYWMPEQQPDEVLIVKLADTAAETNPDIAGGCPHVSPEIPGTENEGPRASIEARVLAFW